MPQTRVKPVSPGELLYLVALEQNMPTTGPNGNEIESWTTLATIRARKDDLRGSERFQADQLSAKWDTLWTIWYRADTDPDLVAVAKLRRLTYQGRIYDIVHARHDGKKRWLELETIAKATN